MTAKPGPAGAEPLHEAVIGSGGRTPRPCSCGALPAIHHSPADLHVSGDDGADETRSLAGFFYRCGPCGITAEPAADRGRAAANWNARIEGR